MTTENKGNNLIDEKENGQIDNNNKDILIPKEEEDLSQLSDLKVFNGLVQEDKVIKKLNHIKNHEPNKNLNNNKKDFDTYFNDNKNLDLNFISFGDTDNLFFNNNISKRIDDEETEKKNTISKQNKIKKLLQASNIINLNGSKCAVIEENISSESSKRNRNDDQSSVPAGLFMTTEGMKEKEEEEKNKKKHFNPFIDSKENKEEKIERNFSESKNYFRISSINQGYALVVTGDDVVFNFPAILLPTGAKLGETFTFDIKSLDTYFAYKNAKTKEIENIQKKYLPEDNDNGS